MSACQLGNLQFRLAPKGFSISYSINYRTIDTIGGQVFQVIGSTVSDLTVTVDFGQQRNPNKQSWELAEEFHRTIRSMMDEQTSIATPKDYKASQQHKPFKFTFFDGTHNIDVDVLIKSVSDPDGGGAVHHSTGKFSHSVSLTLFVVSDKSQILNQIASDAFIDRFAGGVGWARTTYNGSMQAQDAIAFIQAQSPSDPTLNGYLVKLLGEATK